MGEQESWRELRDRRMGEPGAVEAYEAARLAYELEETKETDPRRVTWRP